MMSSFKFKGQDLPVFPKSGRISYQDLDGESERNAKGYLVRQVIRTNVVKIELEFPPMPEKDAKALLALFNKHSEFSFTYPDSFFGGGSGVNTITAYCGDRSLGYMWIKETTYIDSNFNTVHASETMYDGLTVSIIEY